VAGADDEHQSLGIALRGRQGVFQVTFGPDLKAQRVAAERRRQVVVTPRLDVDIEAMMDKPLLEVARQPYPILVCGKRPSARRTCQMLDIVAWIS
jgi:hypothetical protein